MEVLRVGVTTSLMGATRGPGGIYCYIIGQAVSVTGFRQKGVGGGGKKGRGHYSREGLSEMSTLFLFTYVSISETS